MQVTFSPSTVSASGSSGQIGSQCHPVDALATWTRGGSCSVTVGDTALSCPAFDSARCRAPGLTGVPFGRVAATRTTSVGVESRRRRAGHCVIVTGAVSIVGSILRPRITTEIALGSALASTSSPSTTVSVSRDVAPLDNRARRQVAC